MGPKRAPKDKRFDFSSNLYAPVHVHVVQISIMHITALKTHLMRKNVERNPEKSQKITQHSCCSMLKWEKKLKARRDNGYRFVPKVGAFAAETIMLVVRRSGLWEAYTQTCPKWDKIFTTPCWCRSMTACQVSWISDKFWIYYNLNQVSRCFRASDGARVFDIHSHFLHGT